MKKKLMIGIVIVLVLLMGGLVTFVLLNKDDSNAINNDVSENENNNTSNVIELTDKEQEVFNSLLTYGKEIYEEESYTDFEKDDRGVYYATINDLIAKNYDTSMIDESCDKDAPIIFFDIDHKMFDDYETEPLQIVISCEGVENNS